MNNKLGRVLEDYDASRCQELYAEDSGYALSTRSDAVSSSKCHLTGYHYSLLFSLSLSQSDSDSEGYARYRQKLQTKGAKLYAQMASGFSRRSQHFKAKFGNFLATPKKPAEER